MDGTASRPISAAKGRAGGHPRSRPRWARGTVRVAVLDGTGEEIEGYGLADCDAISADAVRHVVTWNGDPDLSRLSGRAVRLRFEIREAKLYAAQFVSE